MKLKIILLASLLIVVYSLNAQTTYLPSAIFPSAGANTNTGGINISKWRLGEVHIVTLNATEIKMEPVGWKVSVYPNPAKETLYISFQAESKNEFSFEITNLEGKRLVTKKSVPVIPGSKTEIDISHLASGLYLLSIIPTGKEFVQVAKFQKL